MLGVREPAVYGTATLGDVELLCHKIAGEVGADIDCRQSNHEGALLDWIQQSRGAFDGIVINAGAYTHTSVALYDALKLTDLPVIEVHLSNVFQREAFRHHSFISPAASGIICGLGVAGYAHALRAVVEIVLGKESK
jgi:3-dehydroquinate dehydratase-2